MIKIHRRLILTAVISVCVFSSQTAIYAQSMTPPREPTTSGGEGTREQSQAARILLEILGEVARIICEERGKCPRTQEIPSETESPAVKEYRPPSRVELSPAVPAQPNLAPSRSFSFFTPPGWTSYEEQSSVTVAPPNEYVNGNLTNGVILGLADLNGGGFESGTDRYVRGILSANKYLKRVGRPESNVVNSVACITTRLTGVSPQTGYVENAVIYTCQRNAQNLFYVVNVNSGPNANRYEEGNKRIIQSLSFR